MARTTHGILPKVTPDTMHAELAGAVSTISSLLHALKHEADVAKANNANSIFFIDLSSYGR
jgi:hypothetical protein